MHKHSSLSLPLLLAGVLLPLLILTGCDSSGSNENNGSQNQAPTAEVTVSSSMVDVDTQVTLDGSGSSDPDGDNLTFNWTLDTPSNSSASLSDQNAEKPTFTPDVKGDYVATLEVSDGDATDTDDGTVTAETAVVEINSDIDSDRTLTPDNKYLVTTSVEVNNSSTLTIDPGVEIMFENDVSLQINAGSAIVADGTESDPILMTATDGNEQQGWWRGVGIKSTNTSNTFNYVEIRHAGSTDMNGIGRAANVGLSGGTVQLTNSTIADGAGYGVYLDTDTDTFQSFSGNSFSGNANAPMWIPFDQVGALDAGSSFPSEATVRVFGGSFDAAIDTDVTMVALSGDTPYRFSSTPSINDGGTLTIDPGVEMTFENDVAFHVNGGGALVADGTTDQPITMTATAGNGQQGWWRGLAIYSGNTGNTLNYVEIRHAGSTDMNGIEQAANVALNGGPNSAATVTLTNSTIADGAGYGVYFDTDTDTFQSFSGNSFSGNANAPMWIPFDQVGALDAGSSFPSEATVRVFGGSFDAAIDSDVTMAALSGDTPYRFSSTPSINDGGTLTIDPGVEMTFENDVAFHVNGGGALVADGTTDEPITMTATAGNDQQGWWRGVGIYSGSTSNMLNYAEVRHAGSTDMSGIQEAANVALSNTNNAFLELTNSTLSDSAGDGVYCDGSDATLSTSENIFNNIAGQNVANCQ